MGRYQHARVTREKLQELLKEHGRDFEAIAKVVKVTARTVYEYACTDGLLVELSPMTRGPKPSSLHARRRIFARDPWDLDWTDAPIAKRYGLHNTNYGAGRRTKPLKEIA